MQELSNVERELVALGAALASNCIPCIEYHIPEARKAGLCDRKINEAVLLADKVRQVPARKVLAAARSTLSGSHLETPVSPIISNDAESAPDNGAGEPCCI